MSQIDNNDSRSSFALGRSVQPYAGIVVIFSLLTVFGLYYTFSSGDWNGLYVLFGWIFVAFNIWFGLCYRIYWHNGEIIQKAVAGNVTKIKADEITRIEQETSNMGTLFTLSRPMRRIVIYADGGQPRYIDVSLKHFVADDVLKLMKVIHERRPNLAIPK